MFNFCCFKRSTKRGVKSLEIYNKDYKIDKNRVKLLTKQSSSSINPALKNNHVLASIPLNSKNINANQLKKGGLQLHPTKTILKSEYDSLIQSFRGTNQKWTDPDFPPTANSWGYPNRKAFWKRISDTIPDTKFVENNFTSTDIFQGKIGDCYFLSSVAGLAENPERIIRIFPNTQVNKNGIYMARILHKGVFQQVVVDDFFPYGEDGNLLSAKPAGGNEIWVMILEKCWAKLYGSYKAIQSGFPEEVLRAISSAPTYHFEMTETHKSDAKFLPSIWERMMRSQKKNYVMCAGSISDQNAQFSRVGLVSGHAYTILEVCQVPQKVVKLRNPWGHKEWTGRAGKNDRGFWNAVSQQTKRKLEYYTDEENDGIFFMLWEDFTTYFNTVDFCNYQDNAHYYYYEQAYQNHVPIYYEVETKGGTNTFILSQASFRERSITQDPDKIQLNDATFLLARVNSSKVEYMQSSTSNSISDFCMTCRDMEAGKYVLVTFMDGSEKQIKATLSIYTENNTNFFKSQSYSYDFLNKIFISHADSNPAKQILNENPVEWACFGYIKESTFGYSIFHLDAASTTSLDIQFDEAQYDKSPFYLLPNNRGKGRFKLVCKKGEDLAVVSKIYSNQLTQAKNQGSFPMPKINRVQ